MCAELISIVLIFFNIHILTEMLKLLDSLFGQHWFTGLTKFYIGLEQNKDITYTQWLVLFFFNTAQNY